MKTIVKSVYCVSVDEFVPVLSSGGTGWAFNFKSFEILIWNISLAERIEASFSPQKGVTAEPLQAVLCIGSEQVSACHRAGAAQNHECKALTDHVNGSPIFWHKEKMHLQSVTWYIQVVSPGQKWNLTRQTSFKSLWLAPWNNFVVGRGINTFYINW